MRLASSAVKNTHPPMPIHVTRGSQPRKKAAPPSFLAICGAVSRPVSAIVRHWLGRH